MNYNNQDKRISFQSIFSSLCNLYQGGKFDANDLEAMAYGLNEKLHKSYPAQETNLPPESMMKQQAKEVDGWGKPKIKICPVPDCGHPMIRQYNKKNPKAPDWKCSDKNCKFSKAYDGGWRKSEFITGAWDEKDTTQERQADNDYEANQQEVPPEYGNHYDRQ